MQISEHFEARRQTTRKSALFLTFLCCYPIMGLAVVAFGHPFITNPGTLLDGFENINDWMPKGGTGATFENDTTIFKFGNQSIKVNTTGGNGAFFDKTVSWDFSTGNGFSLWVYINDVSKLSSIILYIYSESSPSRYFQKAIYANACHFQNGWNHLVFLKSELTNVNSADWNNTIKYIRIRVYPLPGQDVSVNFDDLRFGMGGKTKVIVTFDDGYESVINKAYSILSANNQKGVAFINSSIIGASSYCMTLANLITLRNAGWDISNHTATHKDLTAVSQEEMEADIDDGYEWLVANGFRNTAKFFAYPYHDYNDAVVAKVKERHILARGGTTANIYGHFEIPSGYDFEFRLGEFSIDYTVSVATAEAQIDEVIEMGGLLTLMFHRIVDANPTTNEYLTADFQAISDYLKAKQDAGLLEVITYSDYYNALTSIKKSDYPVILTMQTEPTEVNTITPPPGDHQYAQGITANISAQRFVDCPDVYVFGHWEGDVNDPNSANTTVVMDADKTVKAVFVDGRRCGDECHPYPIGDLDKDCVVTFGDFALFASHWLDCTKPECD